MKLEKVNMTNKSLKTAARSGNKGFTAIEIAMVAAVIAILSLIVLPIFRNRVEDAKIAAAQGDLSAMMKAEQVVKADIDAYARLEDLDNVELLGYTAVPANGVDKEVPFFTYTKPSTAISPDPASRNLFTTDADRVRLAGTADNPKWRGPYIAFQNAISYENLQNPTVSPLGAFILRSQGGDFQSAIQDFASGPFYDSPDNRIPVDPWGNPYLFFPPNGNSADPDPGNGSYATSAIYSMGPNGQPGDGTQATNPLAYTRAYAIQNPGVDGTLGDSDGDDLMVEF